MNIVSYVPRRDILGRFTPSKKKIAKVLFYFLVAASFYGNYWLASKIWNIKCSEGGYFTTKADCNTLAEYKRDAQESYRIQTVWANSNQEAKEYIDSQGQDNY